MVHKKFRIVIVSFVFLAILLFPIMNGEIKLFDDISSSENRRLASKPVLNLNHLDPFPEHYEKYYNDNFTLRFTLIRYYNLVNLLLFKKSPVPEMVIIGREGWYFLADKEIDAYRGKHRFENSELESFKLELEFRKKYLESRNCKFYFFVAPVKASIYPEYLPSGIFRISNQSLGEQLNDYLENNSEVLPIDMFKALRKKKNTGYLYYKLDNHWNKLGAFYAASEVLHHIQTEHQELYQLNPDSFNIMKTEKNGGNLVGMLGIDINYKDMDYKLMPKSGFKATDAQKAGYPIVPEFIDDYENVKEIKGSKKPRVLIISDSFGVAIFPFISEAFGKSVKIFDAWQFKLNEDIVEAEKPDIVILMVLESHLRNMLKYQARKGLKKNE